MSSIPIYTGHWTDWSYGRVLGGYRTYDVRDTQYLIGGTSAFVTFVGGCVWALYAFSVHQRFYANRSDQDVVSLQHRLVYRNDSTPAGAVVDAFWVYWWWKPWKLSPPRRRSKPRAKHVGPRTLALMLPALTIFSLFAVASVFSSRIAVPAYRNNTVLVRNNYGDRKCGITLFDDSQRSVPSYDIKNAVDTHAGVSYARSCYSPEEGIFNPISCSIFVTTALNYTRQEYVCPFGDQSQSFTDSICHVNSNNVAHHLSTAFIDSHHDLGINAPPGDRIQVRKNQTCSPLSTNGFTSSGTGHGSEVDTIVTNYNYGATGDYQTTTYQYNPAAIHDNVPFEILYVRKPASQYEVPLVTMLTSGSTVTYNATGRHQWVPVSNISRDDADVTLVFLAPNSVVYRNSTIDPFFKATYNLTELSIGYVNITVYNPDYPVSVMGCIEQYSICNGKNHCTPMGGQDALGQQILTLNLNNAQFVTAQRMIYMIGYANLWSSINGIGPDALKVWEQTYDFVSPVLPQNQWKLEVEGWFETTLAKWQAFTVEYAYNNANARPAGYIGFPVTNASLHEVWRDQCGNQQVKNLGFYQNISVFGFAFIWAIGGFLILLSWLLKLCISTAREWREEREDKPDGDADPKARAKSKGRKFKLEEKSKARRNAWNIDGKLQQNRLALKSAGYTDLIGGRGDVPHLDTKLSRPLPFEALEDDDHDTFYSAINPEPNTEPDKETSHIATEERAANPPPIPYTSQNAPAAQHLTTDGTGSNITSTMQRSNTASVAVSCTSEIGSAVPTE